MKISKQNEARLTGSPLVLPKALPRWSEPQTPPPADPLPDIEKEIERLLTKQPLPACLVVNGQMEIVRLYAGKGASRNTATQRGDLPPLKVRRNGFLADLRFALDRAQKDGKPARKEGAAIRLQRGARKLDFEVIPVSRDGSSERHYVILLRGPVRELPSTLGNQRRGQNSSATQAFAFRENMRLGTENKDLRSQLESLAQEHRASVEELQTADEELSSANAQLDTLKRTLEQAKDYALLELANDAVIVRDVEGRIQFWNRGAEELYGWKKEEALGKLKQELLRTKFPKPLEEIDAELARRGHWEGELEHVRRDGSRRIVRTNWALQKEGGYSLVLEINSDVTGKKQVEESLRKLSSYLIRVQDEERRRIARELHDSTGQKLMALKMTLNSLGKRNPKLQAEPLLAECVDMIDGAMREIRTLAQLLHPPLLDEAGLAVATRWLVDGFSKRSGVVIDLTLPSDLGRMPENVETALFRIIQEALNNIHQHSGADRAKVEISQTASIVTLRVKDNGNGIREILKPGSASASPILGVGIQGMKERLAQLDGTLEIVSGKNGTTVTAKVPNRPGP